MFFCNLHSQIHKYNLHSLLKNVDSNASDDPPSFLTVSNSATADRFLMLSFTGVALFFLKMFCLTAWLVLKEVGHGTSWARWFLLPPLTRCHRWPSHPPCVRLAKNNARLSCFGPAHLAWSTPAGGCVCGLVGKLRPTSLIHDPFLYSAVDTNPPLRCTTWNGDVSGSNREYICTKKIDTQGIWTPRVD